VRFYWPKGLLNNRKATTHWLFCEQMANQYRNVQTLPDTIFVRTGCIYTAGIDLALSPVEEDGGWEVAAGVARHADFHAPPGPVSGER
jgi:transcriptional regulator GlxA family with amidase domain